MEIVIETINNVDISYKIAEHCSDFISTKNFVFAIPSLFRLLSLYKKEKKNLFERKPEKVVNVRQISDGFMCEHYTQIFGKIKHGEYKCYQPTNECLRSAENNVDLKTPKHIKINRGTKLLEEIKQKFYTCQQISKDFLGAIDGLEGIFEPTEENTYHFGKKNGKSNSHHIIQHGFSPCERTILITNTEYDHGVKTGEHKLSIFGNFLYEIGDLVPGTLEHFGDLRGQLKPVCIQNYSKEGELLEFEEIQSEGSIELNNGRDFIHELKKYLNHRPRMDDHPLIKECFYWHLYASSRGSSRPHGPFP
jgi:hypothetical protein